VSVTPEVASSNPLAVVTAAILAGVALLRATKTAEKEEGFIICGGAASEMARRIREHQTGSHQAEGEIVG